MKKTKFLFLVLLIGCGINSTESEEKPSGNELPHIIYILADDMGYGDLSSLNNESGIHTPHMDRIVREGIYFTDFHTNSAVCTPTRYGILTGRYAWRSRLKTGVLWGYDPPLIEPERITVASFLQENGYHTACVGKWHLGLGWQPKNPEKAIETKFRWDHAFEEGDDSNVDFSKQIIGGPADLGFDYSYIIPASLDMSPYVYIENKSVVELPTAFTPGKNQTVDGRGVFWRSGEVSPSFQFENVLTTLTDKAVAYIHSRENEREPFFLYFPLTAPHTPWLPTDAVEGVSQAGRYGDFVTLVDQTVGAILEALDESGLSEQTLIIVSSDNGAHWTPEDKEEFAHRANHIYRGQKADIYEGGHRVPFIARWPGRISPGSKTDETMCSTDLLATVSGIIGTPLPQGSGEDSYNMLAAYFAKKLEEPIREYTIHHSLNGHFSIRKGNWKLTPHLGSGGFTQPNNDDPKEAGKNGTLYDLQKDPLETTNLYNEQQEIVSELVAILDSVKQ
ncbi:MAG: arylsulfatase [Bacteroidota bacterium]